jgi:tetratricopeptide (TPR) repeat protein
MRSESDRVQGWKAIGAYMGRDRTTAIRWGSERGLPVHKVPGGKRSTVYALKSELDSWRQSLAQDAALADDLGAPDLPKPVSKMWRPYALALLACLLIIFLLFFWWRGSAETRQTLRDPKLAALYVEAHDNVSRRDKSSIDGAIAGFQQVVARAPGFAPAHSGLADAYLLSPEYGSLTYESAYGRAKVSALKALKIDPQEAEAYRALAYLAYWWEHDPVEAGRNFRKALEFAPDDGRAHFWYGAILADNGEYTAAQREFDAARLISPGSLPIEMHLAFAKWRQGDTQGGIRSIEAIVARNPRFALAYQHLAIVYAGVGDFARYLEMVRKNEALRGSPEYSKFVKSLDDAMKRGGVAALKVAVIEDAVAGEANRPFPDHSLSAFLASSAGDRARLVSILELADRNKEKWGAVGYVVRIAARWKHDPIITGLLARRRSPLIEPVG